MDVDKIRRARADDIANEWWPQFTTADIKKLASSFKDGQPCTLDKYHRGSFNVGFPAPFDDGTKWFIRFPIPGLTAILKEKFLSEIATMKLVQERTSIRTPALIAWATEGDHPTGLPFMITEFLEGKALGYWKIPDLPSDKKEFVYRQLAQVVLSLSDLRFDKIGSWTTRGEDLALENRPLSHCINILIIDGTNVDAILPVNKTFDSCAGYTTCLARIIRARLEEQRNSIYDKTDGLQKACAVHLFESLLSEEGIPCSDDDPFVLMHGDLRAPNILVNPDTFQFTGIIDWEWARVVPIGFLLPPFWLTGLNVEELAESEDTGSFFEECGRFIDIMEELEDLADYPQDHRRLSKVMRSTVQNPMKFWVAMCLQTPYDFESLYWDKVSPPRRRPDQDEDDVVEEFLRGPCGQVIEELIERKLADLDEYRRELERSKQSETETSKQSETET